MKIIISGKPRVGKTTLIVEVITNINIPWVGFYTQEIRQHGKRLGFKIIDMEGEEKIFAHVDIKTRYRVGKYGVDIKAVDETVEKIKNVNNSNFFIIDEIGKMELYSQSFRNFITELFISPVNILATMKSHRDDFCSRLLQKTACLKLNLTPENYNQVKKRIFDLVSKLPEV